MAFNESIVEDAAKSWFEDMGYAIDYCEHLWLSKCSSAGITKKLAQSAS